MTTETKKAIRVLLIGPVLMIIPLAFKLFTTEFNWSIFDFVFASILISSTSFAFWFFTKKSHSRSYRFAVGLAIVGMFLLVWINGAVGIIGSENNPINVLYSIVVLIGFFGFIVFRAKSKKMIRAMYAMATIQMLIPFIAILYSPEIFKFEPMGFVGTLTLNGGFATLFVGSALLFKQSSELEENEK